MDNLEKLRILKKVANQVTALGAILKFLDDLEINFFIQSSREEIDQYYLRQFGEPMPEPDPVKMNTVLLMVKSKLAEAKFKHGLQ